MTNSTTATVETLTAEVRVLMVGSRQVTLSVYGQLDEVGPEDIEPFGRVNPRDARSVPVAPRLAAQQEQDRRGTRRPQAEASHGDRGHPTGHGHRPVGAGLGGGGVSDVIDDNAVPSDAFEGRCGGRGGLCC
jgi:hypothetical protein